MFRTDLSSPKILAGRIPMVEPNRCSVCSSMTAYFQNGRSGFPLVRVFRQPHAVRCYRLVAIRVRLRKLDPISTVDSGTMSPV